MATVWNKDLPKEDRVDPDEFNPMKKARGRVGRPSLSLEGARDRCGLPTVEWHGNVTVVDLDGNVVTDGS
jgi:hypothetical protein